MLAVAGGIVDTAEHQNNGYGNLIVIKHHGAYSSAYGHLSNFAAGLRKDTRVRQGDTIGYVGQTGLATGPHLHYEFRVNDEQVDPMKLALPTSMPLEGLERGRYLNSSMALRTQLERAGEMTLAAVE
ncbi:MAG: M23 family metallopeptidase [Candidatus Accumulibacter necessarius]|uniref:M23 family metallopeptidase n=1 Tax=Candidatus Accumulibacter necessarius TaxID=2954386 RepID=UPI002FC333BF